MAAYKEYCAANGKRPKFTCGGDVKEKQEKQHKQTKKVKHVKPDKPDKGVPPSIDSIKQEPDGHHMSHSCPATVKNKKGGKQGGKHPPVTPWFALVVENLDGSYVRLLEVYSGVHSDGSCKAREWLRSDKRNSEAGGELTPGLELAQTFLPASLYPQMMSLPATGWLPVQVWRTSKEEPAGAAAAAVRPSPVEVEEGAQEHETLVVIVNEASSVAEACRILGGEVQVEPFPTSWAPLPRELGKHTHAQGRSGKEEEGEAARGASVAVLMPASKLEEQRGRILEDKPGNLTDTPRVNREERATASKPPPVGASTAASSAASSATSSSATMSSAASTPAPRTGASLTRCSTAAMRMPASRAAPGAQHSSDTLAAAPGSSSCGGCPFLQAAMGGAGSSIRITTASSSSSSVRDAHLEPPDCAIASQDKGAEGEQVDLKGEVLGQAGAVKAQPRQAPAVSLSLRGDVEETVAQLLGVWTELFSILKVF